MYNVTLRLSHAAIVAEEKQ